MVNVLAIRFDDAPEDRRERPALLPLAGGAYLAPQHTAKERACRVGDRQREDQERHARGQSRRTLLPSGDGGRRQHESEEQAPAVAEKNRGRREVVDQKPERRADQRGEQHRLGGVAAGDQNRRARGRRQ